MTTTMMVGTWRRRLLAVLLGVAALTAGFTFSNMRHLQPVVLTAYSTPPRSAALPHAPNQRLEPRPTRPPPTHLTRHLPPKVVVDARDYGKLNEIVDFSEFNKQNNMVNPREDGNHSNMVEFGENAKQSTLVDFRESEKRNASNLLFIDESSAVIKHEERVSPVPTSTCPPELLFRPHENDHYKNITMRFPSWCVNYDRRSVYNESLVVMVPVSNTEDHLDRLFRNLCSLTYPHLFTSVVLGEDSSTDSTYARSAEYLGKIQRYYRSVKLVSLQGRLSNNAGDIKHDLGLQKARRSHLATSRNQLLFAGLADAKWVLWMDSDVMYIPPDLIERLMSADKQIVTPACMYKNGRITDVYDRNTWRETPESWDFQRKVSPGFLMLEGYEPTMRKYLSDLRVGVQVVEIDGVGGCVLLVKAEVHRNGLVFPPFVFNHHIETEGLAKMAREMGYTPFGMPYLEVFHS